VGIDGFISTWWGQGTFDDKAFPMLLDAAAKHDFQATVYWETTGKDDAKRRERAIEDMAYVLKTYAKHPAFLKLDGKPVIFVYGRVMGEVPASDWPAIIKGIREKAGMDCILIADGYRAAFARMFDGVHTYNIARPMYEKSPDEMRAAAKKLFAGAVDLARSNEKISCLTIIPGYDDTKTRKPGINTVRHDGQTYRVLWEEAIAADPDWILITTWNEWHEGSEIEPSVEFGDLALKTTVQYAPEFKKKPAVEAKAATVSASRLAPEKAQELRKLYGGATIGVLPGFENGVILSLLDAGLEIKELTPEEMLDPAAFNAKRFPVLINAGNESYVQTAHEKGDVDRAIARYLNEGGLLMALTLRPLPFFLNEKKEHVNSARQFGFIIGGPAAKAEKEKAEKAPEKGPAAGGGAAIGSWEKPPAGVKLTFHIDNQALTGLPGAAAFPETGDQRWRPASNGDLSKDDVYLPLIRLKDDKGGLYGDGAVYIEHKSSAPQKGKNIYVWMGLFDVLDKNDFPYALFRFAAGKMGTPKER